MKEIDSSTKNAIIEKLVDNVLNITFYDKQGVPYMTITEDNMVSESMVLKQSICDDSDLKFGGCIASEFNIDLINTESRVFSNDLVGNSIIVVLKQTFVSDDLLYPKNNVYPSLKRNQQYPGNINKSKMWYLFRGNIDSAERDQNNKNIRHIVAYDAFATLYQTDATNILYSHIKNGSTFGAILKSCAPAVISDDVNDLLNKVINEDKNITINSMPIFNDDWIEDNSTVSKGEVVRMCCEMLGGFGVINHTANGSVFDIVHFRDFNSYGPNLETYNFYEQLQSEEYITYGYNNITLPIGGAGRDKKVNTFETDVNARIKQRIYDLSENILCWHKAFSGVNPTLKNTVIYDLFHSYTETKMYVPKYTPMSATIDGRPWIECGDTVRVIVNQTDTDGNYIYDEKGNIKTETVASYVLSKTLTGIKALTDKIEAKGA